MKCHYVVATERETKALAVTRLRMDFIRDLHPEYDLGKVTSVMKGMEKYIRECSDKNVYVGFLGVVKGEIVCSSGIIIYNYAVNPFGLYKKVGYIVNFYTRRKYRRMGYGYGLMEFIKSYARQNRFYKLNLISSREAYSLYKKCGYEDRDIFMEYIL